MRVYVLTYNVPHLKTQQLLATLALVAGRELSMLGLPFNPRAPRQPAFQHRPEMALGGHPKHLAEYYGIDYQTIAGVEELGRLDGPVIIAGAGLLAADFVNRNTVINCHGGLIPSVRGLDAFKWAIHDHQPLGNTLHVIDGEVDAGRHLKALPTPVYRDDTMQSLAQRHYENELLLLGNFQTFLDTPEPPMTHLPERPARMRMAADTERTMISGFVDYLIQYAKG
jgi:phosphoribosylglycinamide formyltransferase 1